MPFAIEFLTSTKFHTILTTQETAYVSLQILDSQMSNEEFLSPGDGSVTMATSSY